MAAEAEAQTEEMALMVLRMVQAGMAAMVAAVQELAQAFPFPSLMQNNAPDDITGLQRLVEEAA